MSPDLWLTITDLQTDDCRYESDQTFSISGCAIEEVDAAVTHNVLIRVLSRLKGLCRVFLQCLGFTPASCCWLSRLSGDQRSALVKDEGQSLVVLPFTPGLF